VIHRTSVRLPAPKPRVFCISDKEEVEPMEHWGIYIAYGWLATLVLAFTDAVRAIQKGPQPQPQRSEPYTHN
jgi:hypothetical protein